MIKGYHVDLEKRGGCGVVARERHESHKKGEMLAKQLKISPLLKILTIDQESSNRDFIELIPYCRAIHFQATRSLCKVNLPLNHFLIIC